MLVKAVLLAVMIGWLLVIGRSLLLPIILALISVYVLAAASEAMGRWPVTRRLPDLVRRLLSFGLFIAAIWALAGIVIVTVEDMIATAPSYQANLERILSEVMTLTHVNSLPDWNTIRAATLDNISIQQVATVLAGSVGSMMGSITLVFVYALFLLGERGSFAHKLSVALPHRASAQQTAAIIRDINDRIGDYLAVKTLINVILGVICFAILKLFGVDYAPFWAIIIALLNYIPYVGSLLGVVFPVLLTVAQFGSLQVTLAVTVTLTGAQIFVGNWVEPRMIGRRVNLSPFVVMVALSLWTALWGIAGAILAVPLTSVLTIIFAAFAPTRPIAVMLADDVSVFEDAPDESARPAPQAR